MLICRKASTLVVFEDGLPFDDVPPSSNSFFEWPSGLSHYIRDCYKAVHGKKTQRKPSQAKAKLRKAKASAAGSSSASSSAFGDKRREETKKFLKLKDLAAMGPEFEQPEDVLEVAASYERPQSEIDATIGPQDEKSSENTDVEVKGQVPRLWREGPKREDLHVASDEDIRAIIDSGHDIKPSPALQADHPHHKLFTPLDWFFLIMNRSWYESRVENLKKLPTNQYSCKYEWTLDKIMHHQGLTMLQTIEPRRALWAWFSKSPIIPGVLGFADMSRHINRDE